LSKVDKATLPTQQFILNNTTMTVKMKTESFQHTTTTVSVTSYHKCGCLILCWWELYRIQVLN